MTGQEYEYAAARYLRWHGYHQVRVTRASGDYGVDLTCSRRGRKYAVQCKYYTHPVGLPAVQQAVAGKAQYGCDSAMVITNTTLTRSARQLAQSNEVLVLEQVQPRASLPRPVRGLLLMMLALAWMAGLHLLGSRAWRMTGCFPVAWPLTTEWLYTAAVLVSPLLLWLLKAIAMTLFWRISLRRTIRREERFRQQQENERLDLDACVTAAAALGMQTMPPQAQIPAGCGASTKRVMADFPDSVLMRELLRAVGHKSSFTLHAVTKHSHIDLKTAGTLAACLVRTGLLVCARNTRYCWTLYACGDERSSTSI